MLRIPHNVLAFPETSGSPGAHPPRRAGGVPTGTARIIALEGSLPAARAAPQQPLSRGQLWTAVNEGRVCVHYQPQCEFASGRTRAVEALARIVGEAGELVFPERFIDEARASALVVPLGRAVISQACRDLAGWRADGIAIEQVAINLSARQVNADQSLAAFVARSLADSGLSAANLEFELTLHQLRHANVTGIGTLRCLAEAGARMALAGFGYRYSSLACAELPMSTVKLDRRMVGRIPAHQSTERVIRHLVERALAAGIRVVAEGIETWDQHDYLALSGCQLGQGFLFAEPLGPADLADFVRYLGTP